MGNYFCSPFDGLDDDEIEAIGQLLENRHFEMDDVIDTHTNSNQKCSVHSGDLPVDYTVL